MKKSWFDDIVVIVVFLLVITTFIPFGYTAVKTFEFDRARAEGFVAFIVNSNSNIEEEQAVETCDGSGFITHGDGHKTPCPGCNKCQSGQVSPSLTETQPTQNLKKKDFFRDSSKKNSTIPSRAAQSYGSKYWEKRGW